MDINMITEPKWKSYIVQTNDAIFTPEQCEMIIDAGRNEPKQDAYVGGDKKIKSGIIDTKTRTSHISWIPFSKMEGMYKDIEKLVKATNGNHFGQAIFFASFIRHRVKPVIRGNRKSLVMWFGGTPFK